MRLHERTRIVGNARRELAEAVEDIADKHGLTLVETAYIVHEAQSWWLRYLLRADRHPDDPSKKADQQ